MNYIMGLWVDDVRAPEEFYYKGDYVIWICVKSVDIAKHCIKVHEKGEEPFGLISLDHDAGDFGPPDYIKLLDWLEETGRSYPIRIHSQNPVGRQNMERICKRNDWIIVKN